MYSITINFFNDSNYFLKDINRLGRSNKLVNIAKRRVRETKPPKAIVPPKSEVKKTEKPKNKTIDV